METAETPLSTENWKNLPAWMHTHAFYYKNMVKDGPMIKCAPQKANLVSSKLYSDGEVIYHTPVLDLDFPVALFDSTTKGHHHLVIDKVMPAEDYEKLLRVMQEVGLIQKGIIDLQWEAEGMTAIRLPGIKKEIQEKSSGMSKATNSVMTVDENGFKQAGPDDGLLVTKEPSMKQKHQDLFEYTELVKVTKPTFGLKEPLNITDVVDGYFHFLEKKYNTPAVQNYAPEIHLKSEVEQKLKDTLEELIENQEANDASEKPYESPF